MDTPAGNRYSLWLMPRGDAYERLAPVLHELSAACGAPEFPPHVTLLGGIVGARRDIVRQSAGLAERIRPFTIRLERIDYLDEYFRCLFVRAATTKPLREAHRIARGVFDHRREPAFMPHLSLLYGDFNRSTKEGLIARLGSRVNLELKVRSLHLYSTYGEPHHWRCIETFGLK
jgi:2'-5' RNA ligase